MTHYADAQSLKPHPYLIYTKTRIETLKSKLKRDSALSRRWQSIKTRCDSSLTKADGGNMEQMAFAFAMTGDRTYARRAEALLDVVVNKKEWDGMDDRTPRWNSGLATGHTNWSVSVTFDAIYNTLSDTKRKEIAYKIARLGIDPSVKDWISKDQRIHSLNSMGHNWWSAVVFEAGIASLAVMNDIPEAKAWAKEIMDDSEEWIGFSGGVLDNKPATFDPAGGFYESINYGNYALSEYLLFRLAYTNAVQRLQMPYDALLKRTMDWFINSSYPRTGQPLMSFDFGDSNDFANGCKSIMLMSVLGLGSDSDDWYLKAAYDNRKQARDAVQELPLEMLYQPDVKDIIAPALPPSSMYSYMGWAALRSSWKPDATLLGIKSGFTWNHAHADAGSFVLYHRGENLLIDGGACSYARPEYSDYYVTSKAHNVVTFNGEAQDAQDEYHAVKTPGHVYDLLDGGNVKYVLADATGPTSRNFLRNFRNFLWIGNVILIIDDLHTYDVGKFDFLLHYNDAAIKKGPDIEISKGSSAILFRPLYPESLPLGYPHDFPEKMKLETAWGLKEHDPEIKIPYYKISSPVKSDRTKLVNAIILLDEHNQPVSTSTGSSGASGSAGRSNLPVIEKFEGPNYLGIRIIQKGEVTEIYLNLLADGTMMHRNSNLSFNDWETDAYITALTFDQNSGKPDNRRLKSFFVGNGSYLRSKSRIWLSSLSKVFMFANQDGDKLDVKLTGQPLINATIGISTKQLRVNDRPVTPTYDKAKRLILRTYEGMPAFNN